MCIYCGTNNYRKIYENHHGTIGVDNNGRALEVHHIDGDHDNNNPANLTLVTIQEHYNIHFEQGDRGACHAMAIRMNIDTETLSDLAIKHANERVANGTHHFLGPTNNKNRIANGTHPFLNSKLQSQHAKQRVANGTHHLLGSEHALKRLKDGTHPSQIKVCCMFCKNTTDITHIHHHVKCRNKALLTV